MRNYLERLKNGAAKICRGVPRLSSPKQARAIVRLTRTGEYSARQLAEHYNVDVSVRRMQQVLAAAPERAPRLTAEHKKARVKWARYHFHCCPRFWRTVVWSDEKNFNLDDQDGFAYLWADTHLPRRMFSHRQYGGGSVMVWGAFSARGCAALAILKRKVNVQAYVDVLRNNLLSFGKEAHSNGFLFQNGGAIIHRANASLQFLADSNIDVMDWPTRSPDLNPIENIWRAPRSACIP